MKKVSLLILSTTLLLTSCGRASSKKVIVFEKPEGYVEIVDNSVELSTIQQSTSDIQRTSNESPKTDPTDVMLGKWVGEMSGKKLIIVIEKINGNELIGYNQLGTNKRALKGTFAVGDWDQSCSKAFDATLNEPGDDKWDGVFKVKFVGYKDSDDETNDCIGKKYRGSEGQGVWKSNNGKMQKEFYLSKE